MLRNDQERAKCKNQLTAWQILKKCCLSMIRTHSMQETDELILLIDQRIKKLKEQLYAYDLTEICCKPSKSAELLSEIAKLPTTLIETRVELGLSQADFARAANTTPQKVSYYERTKYAGITLKNAIKLAESLSNELRRIRSPVDDQ